MKKNLFIMMSQYGELLSRVGSYHAKVNRLSAAMMLRTFFRHI